MEKNSPCFSEIAEKLGYRNIQVIFSKRLKRSWRLKSYFTGRKEITLPYILSSAPFDVKEAILHWSHLKRPHFKKHRTIYYKQKKELESLVWNYLNSCGGVSVQRKISNTRLSSIETKGLKYDLKSIFDEINRAFFNNELKSYLRWGKSRTKTSYQTWYHTESGDKVSMITIASLYNHNDIPEFAIKSVMFHEMLHIAVPPYTKNGRRIIHGKEFNQAQKRNPDLQKWFAWEKGDLQRILRSRKY